MRPGENPGRLLRLVRSIRDEMALDLGGVRVLTEAASGAYAVTPVLAALAGADVVAVTRDSRYGSADDVERFTLQLAGRLGIEHRIRVTRGRHVEDFAAADLITNSGHVRPIVGPLAAAIRPGAVLSLMFESWEVQAGRLDLDLELLIGRGVQVAGTNERHPHVDVFSYLGAMAVAQLADAGVPAYRGRIAVVCDNPFRRYLEEGLVAGGARVVAGSTLDDVAATGIDAVLVALTPTGKSVLTDAQLDRLQSEAPEAPIVQYWGDLDRDAVAARNLPIWPVTAPGAGHMGVLPSRVGPDPIVRLQAGGLKVGQVLLAVPEQRSAIDLEYVDEYR